MILSNHCRICGSLLHNTLNCPEDTLKECTRCGSKEHYTSQCPSVLHERIKKLEKEKESKSSENEFSIIIIFLFIIGLILYVITPFALLNSSIIFCILSLIYKKKRKTLLMLSILGAIYLLFDIKYGWFSVNILNEWNINQNIMVVFIYFNSISIGYSVWKLIQQHWEQSIILSHNNKLRKFIFNSAYILLIAVFSFFLPVYISINDTLFIENKINENKSELITPYQKQAIDDNFNNYKREHFVVPQKILGFPYDTSTDSIIIIDSTVNFRKNFYVEKGTKYWKLDVSWREGLVSEGGGEKIIEENDPTVYFLQSKKYINISEGAINSNCYNSFIYVRTKKEESEKNSATIKIQCDDIRYDFEDNDIEIEYINNNLNDFNERKINTAYIKRRTFLKIINYTPLSKEDLK